MLLLIDKEKKMTSHDVVDEIRKITGIKKVGHAGTLDPNATGLLIIGVGRESTKLLGNLSKNILKTYEAEVFLGVTKDTDDVEGKTIDTKDIEKLSEKEIADVVKSFVGQKKQMPPIYSAIKVGGKKAYNLARSGKKVNLGLRDITIYSIKLVGINHQIVKFTAEVSSGTYIRSTARDIGEKLGVGAYLRNLRRTKIGKYSVVDARKLGDITSENWKEEK